MACQTVTSDAKGLILLAANVHGSQVHPKLLFLEGSCFSLSPAARKVCRVGADVVATLFGQSEKFENNLC